VRSEALRLQLTLPHEHHAGVLTSLTDREPRIVHVGLTAIRDACPPPLVEYVIDVALAADVGEDSRLLAVNSLARLRVDSVLDAFLQMSDGGRSILGRLRLPPKTPVLVAVIRALALTWSDDRRAGAVLAAARRSSDPEIRQAARNP
jgi:hypothetical protein